MNDADVIEQLLEGLRRQTRPLDAILIVDNASTDATLDRAFPETVTVIRNPENQGTSGTVRTGLAHGLEHGFDWVWLFDADSVPEPDALEKLLAFFERLPPEKREQVCFLAAWPLTATGEIKQQPISLGAGMAFVPMMGAEGFTECDCFLWSGSLFRTAAVARIGLPSADYVLDIAEMEYGYRARQLGFASYVVHSGVIHHDVGRDAGSTHRVVFSLGSLNLRFYEVSPHRCYYCVRNVIYFWLYEYKPRRMTVALRVIVRSAFGFTVGFAARPFSHRRQLAACIRGIRDGLTGRMERRY